MDNPNEQRLELWVSQQVDRLQPKMGWTPDTERALNNLHEVQVRSAAGRRRNVLLIVGCCTISIAISVLPSTRSAARLMLNKIFVWQVEGRLSTAPNFELENIVGGTSTAADFRGKVAVVDFWATWCAPCIAEIPNFNNLQEAFHNKGVKVIGMTIQSPHDEIADKAKALGITYPVLVGDDAVMEGFGGFRGFPTTFVITQDWKIYKSYTGLLPHKQESIRSDVEKLLAEQSQNGN